MKILTLVILAIVALNCSQKEKNQVAEPKNWQSSMHQLSHSLSQLLPLSVSADGFYDSKNDETINREMKSIIDASRSLKGHVPSNDPIYSHIVKNFNNEMKQALHQYRIGNKQFAKNSIRNSTNYCMGCHTKNNLGREIQWMGLAKLDGFNSFDKGQYLAAVRNFDQALKEFNEILSDRKVVKKDPRLWQMAAKRSLAILVRVKRDPNGAKKVVNKLLKEKNIPPSMRQVALSWRKSIGEWKKEQKKYLSKSGNWKADYTSRANNLLQRGLKSDHFPQQGAGLIYFLRASSLLHDVLDGEPTKVYANALYVSGLVSEQLKDLSMWTLFRAYYEACINQAPRTRLAKKCYIRYETVVLSSYMGDSYGEGSAVPGYVRRHLEKLRNKTEMGDWNELLNWGVVE